MKGVAWSVRTVRSKRETLTYFYAHTHYICMHALAPFSQRESDAAQLAMVYLAAAHAHTLNLFSANSLHRERLRVDNTTCDA